MVPFLWVNYQRTQTAPATISEGEEEDSAGFNPVVFPYPQHGWFSLFFSSRAILRVFVWPMADTASENVCCHDLSAWITSQYRSWVGNAFALPPPWSHTPPTQRG